jgi:GNAT superfamily N-acetyltransferase
MKVNDEIYELAKMAVTDAFQGKGIGKALIEHCIREAAALGAKTLILYSNTKLTAAINLYKKYGFTEIPAGDSHYVRSNIKMQMSIVDKQ